MATDWKETLPPEAKEILNEILEKAKRYRYAYMQADDIKTAQLWVALIELARELTEIKKTLGKVEEPFKAIIEVGEKEKRKTIARIVEEIVRPTNEETQEATRKLVDSLMKF